MSSNQSTMERPETQEQEQPKWEDLGAPGDVYVIDDIEIVSLYDPFEDEQDGSSD